MTKPRWQLRNYDCPERYCNGLVFDQSQMDDLEFERLLLWSYRFPKYFDAADEAALTAEVYRRAAQVRAKRPPKADKPLPVEIREVGVGEIDRGDEA